MGFMDFMGKMISGQPVFDENSQQKAPTSQDSGQTPPQERVTHGARFDASGRKVIAEAEVTRVETHERGSNIELWGHIKNTSAYPVFLDKINLLGRLTELDYELRPGEEREYRLYNGPAPKHDSYRNAELYYRDQASNDYFLAYHQIHYGGNSDGKTYDVLDLRLIRPIKDI